MRRYVLIGTAGHVDHGKTCLIKALTGTDTDRLKEEKRLGVTIENGFAFLDLPGGTQAGIIDVPGHEKFIKNMLAGAGGVDIAMLVIAADEGIMPQTVEHLEILSLLGVQKGVIVISKEDVPEKKKNLRKEIASFVQGTFLETAPVVETSARLGNGIEELRQVLIQMAESYVPRVSGNISEKADKKEKFRLPIDRVFSLKGFGTVVTGTLLDGKMELETPAVLYPSEKEVKLRQIQVNSRVVSKAFPGQRVAVNLPGIGTEEISRGEVLAAAGSLQKTRIADVRLKLLKSGKRSLKSGSRVHLYYGAANLVCKVILSGRETLSPGEEDLVQLRMEQETVLKTGDHFVIRFYSPVETIGGGVVVEPNAVKRKKKEKETTDLKKTGCQSQGLSESQENMFRELQGLYEQAGFAPPLTQDVKTRYSREKEFSSVFFWMVKQKILVRLDEKHYIHQKYRNQAWEVALDLYKENGAIQTGVFRDRLQISRKCAITLLEGFDKERLTVLCDGERKIRRS